MVEYLIAAGMATDEPDLESHTAYDLTESDEIQQLLLPLQPPPQQEDIGADADV